MSTVLPALVRTCSRTGVRLLASGVLAIGLITSAPISEAHSATVEKTGHHTKSQQKSQQLSKVQRHRRHTLSRVNRAVRIAAAQKGDPYGYGAAGPNRFDCSGLTFYSYHRAGFRGLPRTSSAQARFARHISRPAMRRGDLMFFTGGGGVYHVGVFAGWSHGRRLVLHAPYSGTRVRTERVWTNSWFPGTLRFR
jgi:cell wall-associated NlpC family hydrolase